MRLFSNHFDRLAHRQLVHLGGVDARVDRPRHQRHAARLRGVMRFRHHGDRRQSLHARLADSQHMRARPEHAQPLDQVVDIVLEAECARRNRDVARVLPIGDVTSWSASNVLTVSRRSVAKWPESGATTSTRGCA